MRDTLYSIIYFTNQGVKTVYGASPSQLSVASLARRQASRELSMFSHSLIEGREGLAGFRPRTPRFFRLSLKTGSFVSAKGPKTMGAWAWPLGGLCPGPEG